MRGEEINMSSFNDANSIISILVSLTVGVVLHSSCEQSVKYTLRIKVHRVSKAQICNYVFTIHVLCDVSFSNEAIRLFTRNLSINN